MEQRVQFKVCIKGEKKPNKHHLSGCSLYYNHKQCFSCMFARISVLVQFYSRLKIPLVILCAKLVTKQGPPSSTKKGLANKNCMHCTSVQYRAQSQHHKQIITYHWQFHSSSSTGIIECGSRRIYQLLNCYISKIIYVHFCVLHCLTTVTQNDF